MGMEFRHLRCFVALAEELHFGRAAQRLSMSQPPFSVNIRQLEEAVGTRLFDRDSKGVRLTAAGQAFREHAQTLLSRAEEAKSLARDVGAGALGTLRVGFVGSMLYRGLPRWLQCFQRDHPRIEIVLHEINSQQQLEAIVRDELEVGFVHTHKLIPPLTAELVDAEPFVCCVPAGHAMAARSEVPLDALREEPFVLFSRQAAPDYYLRIMDMCQAAGFYPRIRHEVRHWLSVVAVVAQGMGVSVVPAPLQRSGISGAAFRPLAPPVVKSHAYCVWNPGLDQPARELFLAVVRNR
jgi:DNA-binding transcriptional LysR family regulator